MYRLMVIEPVIFLDYYEKYDWITFPGYGIISALYFILDKG